MREPITSINLIFAILVSLSLFGTLAAAEEVNDVLPPSVEPRAPTITVTLEQDEVEIETGPGTTGTSTIQGTITVEKPRESRAETVVIELKIATFSIELIGSVFPPILEFSMPAVIETHTFEVKLQVSPMISTIHIDGTFELQGSWMYGVIGTGGDIPSTTGSVTLIPFFYISGIVQNQGDLLDVPVGSWRTAELKIANQGNDRATIQIKIAADNISLDCELEKTSVTLNEGEDTIVLVKIKREEGKMERAKYTQGVILETKDTDGQTVSYEVTIYMETVYTPGSFFKSTLFKFIICGIVIMAVLIASLVIIIERRRNKRETLMEGVDL